MAKNMIVFIAGMHRSGTSLTAMWLNYSGFQFHGPLLGGTHANKYGHFENIEMLEFAEKVLIKNNLPATGLHLPNNFKIKLDNNDINELNAKIYNLKEESNYFIWKEPRSTLLMNQYKKTIDLKVIAVYRSPNEVIRSLIIREKFNHASAKSSFRNFIKVFDKFYLRKKKLQKSYFRDWEIYNEEIIKFHKRYPEDIFIINPSQIINNKTNVTRELSNFLNFEIPENSFQKIFDNKIFSNESNRVFKSDIYDKLNQISI